MHLAPSHSQQLHVRPTFNGFAEANLRNHPDHQSEGGVAPETATGSFPTLPVLRLPSGDSGATPIAPHRSWSSRSFSCNRRDIVRRDGPAQPIPTDQSVTALSWPGEARYQSGLSPPSSETSLRIRARGHQKSGGPHEVTRIQGSLLATLGGRPLEVTRPNDPDPESYPAHALDSKLRRPGRTGIRPNGN